MTSDSLSGIIVQPDTYIVGSIIAFARKSQSVKSLCVLNRNEEGFEDQYGTGRGRRRIRALVGLFITRNPMQFCSEQQAALSQLVTSSKSISTAMSSLTGARVLSTAILTSSLTAVHWKEAIR